MSVVLVEVADHIGMITLNRPEARNAISGQLTRELDQAVADLDSREDVSCMVLTGADPAFCAGVDLKALASEPRQDQVDRQSGPTADFGFLPPHETPVIGAINGATVTGGLEIALNCDFLIASERARFADTHARVGAMPGAGLIVRLPQLIGVDRARRMSFTGDFVDAETALAWGLVAEVVPHERLLERAREIAAGVASIPRDNVREIRRMYDEIGALAGEAAWQAESDWSRRWMQDHFDQSRLATERENIMARGRSQSGGLDSPPGVRVYAGMDPRLSLPEVIVHAQRVERLGYDGLHVAETVHDAMAVALLAAEHTSRITVRTSVALAFTRSPTLLAYAAWDIAKLSGGRFQLGLGTQIRQNIEDRYGVPFGDDPIGRLRDYVGAVRAAFGSFVSGQAPSYESEHYRVTRLQPYFNPGPDQDTAVPTVYLGGVQRRACVLAGEVADGFVSHPTISNPRYLQETCLPALAEGAVEGGAGPRGGRFRDGRRHLGDHGRDGGSGRPRARAAAPPSGLPLLHPRLRPDTRALRLGRPRAAGCATSSAGNAGTTWGAVLSDEVLDTLVPSGCFDELAEVLMARFAGLGQGITVSVPADEADDEQFAGVVAVLQAG